MPGGATTCLKERYTPPIATEDARFRPTRNMVNIFTFSRVFSILMGFSDKGACKFYPPAALRQLEYLGYFVHHSMSGIRSPLNLPPAYDRISAYSIASVGEKGRKSPGGNGGARFPVGAEPKAPPKNFLSFLDCFEYTAYACYRLLRLLREARYYCD